MQSKGNACLLCSHVLKVQKPSIRKENDSQNCKDKHKTSGTDNNHPHRGKIPKAVPQPPAESSDTLENESTHKNIHPKGLSVMRAGYIVTAKQIKNSKGITLFSHFQLKLSTTFTKNKTKNTNT